MLTRSGGCLHCTLNCEKDEHHSMKVEDSTFCKGNNGTIYMIYSEGMTETTQNGLHQKGRLQQPKMFEVDHEKCPGKIFKN